MGFISLLAPVLPHYGVAVAVSESFFVAKALETWKGRKVILPDGSSIPDPYIADRVFDIVQTCCG